MRDTHELAEKHGAREMIHNNGTGITWRRLPYEGSNTLEKDPECRMATDFILWHPCTNREFQSDIFYEGLDGKYSLNNQYYVNFVNCDSETSQRIRVICSPTGDMSGARYPGSGYRQAIKTVCEIENTCVETIDIDKSAGPHYTVGIHFNTGVLFQEDISSIYRYCPEEAPGRLILVTSYDEEEYWYKRFNPEYISLWDR